VYRAGNVLAGVLVGIIAALPFPVLSYKKLQVSFLATVKATASVMQALTRVDELNSELFSEICDNIKEVTSAVQPQARYTIFNIS
jgi:predicted DNA-binding ArsR family transcriptional regulator